MMAELWEPFTYEFFRNGLMVATLAGALCGMVGTFVVLRNMSYIGHGLSHAVFGGAAASALVGVSFYVGAGVWGLVTALAIVRVSRRGRLGADSIIGVITTASFAFGVVVLNLFGTTRRNIDAVLFGSILGITTIDVLGVAAVGVLSAAVVFFGYRTLVFCTFDPEVAEASGIRTCRRAPDGGDRRGGAHDDGCPRGGARLGGTRHPRRDGAAGHRSLQPDAGARERAGRAHGCGRDGAQLSPGRVERGGDRARGGGLLLGGVPRSVTLPPPGADRPDDPLTRPRRVSSASRATPPTLRGRNAEDVETSDRRERGGCPQVRGRRPMWARARDSTGTATAAALSAP
jgi:hypothetical protein